MAAAAAAAGSVVGGAATVATDAADAADVDAEGWAVGRKSSDDDNDRVTE